MAVTITRTQDVDDDGSYTTGTVRNNAWKQAIYAQIDALFTGAFSIVGPLTVTAFGTHSFSAGGTGGNRIDVRNTTAGAGNYAAVFIGNDTGATQFQLQGYTTTYTPSGPDLADGFKVGSSGAGGLSLAATHASGVLRLYSGGVTARMTLLADGKVGIGTTTPQNPFVVSNAGAAGFEFAPSTGVLLAYNRSTVAYAPLLLNALSLEFSLSGVEVGRFNTGTNLLVGGTAVRATTAGTKAMQLFDGTAPVGTLANGVSLYSVAGKLWAMDAAGTATKLTP